MRRVTETHNIYEFDELSDSVKKILIDNETDARIDDYCNNFLKDDMKEQAKNLLNKYFNITCEDLKVCYSLNYCQGDGAMIEFTINIDDLNNKYHIFNDVEMNIIQDKGLVNDIEVYHNDNLYCHEYTFSIRYNDNFGYWYYDDIKNDYNISEQDFENIENKLINLLDTYNKHYTKSPFIQDIINMNKEFTKNGYALIESIDEKYVLDICKDYEYYENGKIYYED